MDNRNQIQYFYEKVYNSYQKLADPSEFETYERNLALKRIYQQVEDNKILDLGAGNGLISQFFLDKGYEVYGLEWTKAGVENLNKIGVQAVQTDIENPPYQFPNDFFDEVFWGDNIEHLFFPEIVAKEIYRILKPQGRLVVSTPNHGWIINRLYYLIKGVPRRTEGHRLPIWEWQHIRYFNSEELTNFLCHCGFQKSIKIHGAERRFPFSWLSLTLPRLMGSVLIVETWK